MVECSGNFKKDFGFGADLTFLSKNLFVQSLGEFEKFVKFAESKNIEMICIQETKITPNLQRNLETLMKNSGLSSWR